MEMVQEEPEVTKEPVQLGHSDDAEAVPSRIDEEPLERRSVVGTAAEAPIYVFPGYFPALAFSVGPQSGYLCFYGDALGSLFLAAYPCVKCLSFAVFRP